MDERLTQLVLAVQQYPPKSDQRQPAIQQFVEEILRSRTLCRPLKGHALDGIYLQMYQEVQKWLLEEIEEKIEQYHPHRESVREWVKQIREKAFREVLNDEHLKNIALDAQRHSPQSEKRQYALRELVEAIRLSGKLCRPHRNKFATGLYNLVYEEAVNKTLIYVCQKIDTYDPQRGARKFMNWVNFRIDKIILDAQYEYRDTKTAQISSLAELENIAQPAPQTCLSEKLKQFLEEDPHNLFKNKAIRNCPEANFRAIALATLAGKSWEEISEEFGIKVSTLSSFFRRACQSFAPIFQQLILD